VSLLLGLDRHSPKWRSLPERTARRRSDQPYQRRRVPVRAVRCEHLRWPASSTPFAARLGIRRGPECLERSFESRISL